jgi:hypothetical protein
LLNTITPLSDLLDIELLDGAWPETVWFVNDISKAMISCRRHLLLHSPVLSVSQAQEGSYAKSLIFTPPTGVEVGVVTPRKANLLQKLVKVAVMEVRFWRRDAGLTEMCVGREATLAGCDGRGGYGRCC